MMKLEKVGPTLVDYACKIRKKKTVELTLPNKICLTYGILCMDKGTNNCWL